MGPWLGSAGGTRSREAEEAYPLSLVINRVLGGQIFQHPVVEADRVL